MSCRKKAGSQPTSTQPSGPIASDIDDRELSAEAQKRAESKAVRSASGVPAPPFPWVLFLTALVVLSGVAWLTIKYS